MMGQEVRCQIWNVQLVWADSGSSSAFWCRAVALEWGYTYVKELRVVLLAVDDWFTHFGFCVRHKDSKLSAMQYNRNSEGKNEREE